MPKIGKIRFVNFTFNDNRHIYDQTFDFYNGTDTLLNLQNGGGKTVLVQMMLQPIIPKQKLKDRLFKSYFTNAKSPVYIMIEWILDESSKRVMTGIGIKKVFSRNIEDESDNIKIVTFVSEYEGESNFDIKNIELLEEERSIVRLIEFDKVIRNLSNAEKEGNSIWLYRWDLPDDKKEYARRLLTYKINQLEWKNLMVKINESEAGLNSFFNDCKTNNALIKKWFIPTIEEQLNKNGNLVEKIKELIKNHSEQLVKNEDMIKEREIFESFKSKSSELVKALEEYKELLEKSDNNKTELGNAYIFVNNKIRDFELKKEEFIENIKLVENDIKELEYEKMSSEYYDIYNALQQLIGNLNQTDKNITSLKENLNDAELKKKLLLCVKLADELKNLNAKIAKFEAELKKESLEQEDIKNIIHDIEYSLMEKYKQKINNMQKVMDDENEHLFDAKTKLSEDIKEYGYTKKEISSINDELVEIKSRIVLFNQTYNALKAQYPDFEVAKNVNTGEYDHVSIDDIKSRLGIEETDIEKNILSLKEKSSENQKKMGIFEKELKELQDRNQVLAIEKNSKESEYQVYKSEKNVIDKIIRSYQLNEDSLFDNEKLLITLNSDMEKYKKLINDINLENSTLKKQYSLYESGKAFELSADLKKVLEDNNIFVESGYEWLRNVPDNKKEKMKLVKNNPFLPYSLIISQSDFRQIQNTEFKSALSPIIPLIVREKLEKSLNIKSRNSVHTIGNSSNNSFNNDSSNSGNSDIDASSNNGSSNDGSNIDGINFLIPFDDRVLNKNYLKEICDGISDKINKNNKAIENAQEALKNTQFSILKVEGFSYTKESVDRLERETESITEELDKNAAKIADNDSDIALIKKNETENISLQSILENNKNKFVRKKEDIQKFINGCETYSKNLQNKCIKEESLKNAKSKFETLENDISKTRDDINNINIKAANVAEILNKDKLSYNKYSERYNNYTNNTKTPKFIDEDIEKLESKLMVYTSEISGKIQTMQDILEDYKHQRNEKQEMINAYNIEEYLYIGKEFNEFEYERIIQELTEIDNTIAELSDNKNNIQFKIAERNSDLRYVKKNILERCGYEEPKQIEYIRDIDFSMEKNLLKTKMKDIEKELSHVKVLENNLEKVRFSLEEYSVYASKAAAPQGVIQNKENNMYCNADSIVDSNIDGNNGNIGINIDKYVKNLIMQYKEYTMFINDAKNLLTTLYSELENEFVSRNEMFKNLFNSILEGEKRYQPVHALNAFSRVYLQIDRKLEQHSIDIRKIDDMETCIIDNTLSYLKNVYDEMNSIDRNSTIEVNDKRCKMLIINMPDKEEFETIALKEYLKNTINNCVSLYKQGKSPDGLLTNEISTYDLFDRLIHINRIEITLMKIEPNRLKKKTWKQVIEETSGGEKFVSAFVVFISLLTYMRGENLFSNNMDSKVLIMDNPFGPITSEHLLKPLFEIAKKYNTQLICLTDLKEHSIFDRFNLIYSLNIEREVGREEEYIDVKTIKKDVNVNEEEDEVLSASMFRIEDKSRFELVN